MTEPEDFLTRWARRKRAAKVDSQSGSRGDADRQQSSERAVRANDEIPGEQQAKPQAAELPPENVFDLSKLPSLDSIGPATDISAFLQPGVPEALSRAALRRAWSADPGIRDFIGLSENSWDFTASDGMHGFGALDPADAKRLVAHLLGNDDDNDARAVAAAGEPQHVRGNASDANSDTEAIPAASGDEGPVEATESATIDMTASGQRADVASQDNCASQQLLPEPEMTPARRAHGGALPQ